jgi:hypothetical protein
MSHPKTTCGEGIASQPVRREICVAKVLPLLLFHFEGVSRLMILDLEADLGSYQIFLLARRGFLRRCVHAAVHIVVLRRQDMCNRCVQLQ